MERKGSIIVDLLGGLLAYSVLIKQNGLLYIGVLLLSLAVFDIIKNIINFEMSKNLFCINYGVVVLMSIGAIYLDYGSIFQKYTIFYFIFLHLILKGTHKKRPNQKSLNEHQGKKVLMESSILGLLIFGYLALAVDTYGKITDLEKQLDEKAHTIQNEDGLTHLPEKERYTFNRNVSEYYKWRGTLQSFWMDGIFKFEEFDDMSSS